MLRPVSSYEKTRRPVDWLAFELTNDWQKRHRDLRLDAIPHATRANRYFFGPVAFADRRFLNIDIKAAVGAVECMAYASTVLRTASANMTFSHERYPFLQMLNIIIIAQRPLLTK